MSVILDVVVDVVSCVLLIGGGVLSVAASVGLVRFPDLLSKLHAGSKPQILGLLLVLIGIGIQAPRFGVISTLVLIICFQMATTPVGTHMVGRAGYRTKQLRRSMLYRDQLAEAVSKADARDVAMRNLDAEHNRQPEQKEDV